jgi:hypothetical protein
MSFGLSALTVGLIAAGTAVAATVYSADKSRKLAHEQMDATKASQDLDARQAAEAETGAAVAANAKLADSKRRRRSSSLLLSDNTPGTLGGAATALSGGAPAVRVPSSSGAIGGGGGGGTALGAGAPAGSPAASNAYGGGGGSTRMQLLQY